MKTKKVISENNIELDDIDLYVSSTNLKEKLSQKIHKVEKRYSKKMKPKQKSNEA